MENNLDFLEDKGISSSDRNVLKNLSNMGEILKSLKLKMLETEEAANQAKKEYEHYANVIIPQEMFSAGVDSIGLSSGGSLKVVHNFYCRPNKNEADKKKIVKWLRENGGDHLIKHNASVSAKDMTKLEKANIPYAENTDVNTISLKAFIKDKLGITTGIQQISLESIPECVHFQEVTTVELEI